MKFNVTIDKTAEAVVNHKLCINCGECRELCPTGAAAEYQKTVFGMCGSEEGCFSGGFQDAKKRAVKEACSVGCPLGIIPQSVASLVEKGEIEAAADHIRAKNPMPGVCSVVCDHFCQDVCKRSVFGEAPLNMKALERFALTNTEAKPFKYIRKYHDKVAVIGGGPAGLSAAYHLASAGYPVTIFEKDAALGGALRWGIPAFRVDKELMKQEIDRIVSAGIEVKTGWHIGEDHSLDELWDAGYRACLIAVGDSFGEMPQFKGCDGDGVYDAVTVMRQVIGGYDEGVEIGDKVVVVGGGGMAADLARTLVRTGKSVLVVTSDQEEDLPMGSEQAAVMSGEGVELRTSVTLEQIITENNKVKAVELVKGIASNYFCDTVIFAVGQKCIAENICNAETYPDGRIRINDQYKTNKEMIFACGDATGEAGSVVEAIASGKGAAEQIHKTLNGAAGRSKDRALYNAPDGQAIYAENVGRGLAQYEEKILIPMLDEEDLFAEETAEEAAEAHVLGITYDEPAEDILAVLRSAGIEEEMPLFEFGAEASKVAVIGGGISGVTAALSLARKGFKPVVFEREPQLGGNYRWMSTSKRIDKDILMHELAKVEASGIEVLYNVSAGVKPNIEQLFRLGYDAVLFALGAAGGSRHEIEGADCAGVFDMTALMGRLADHEKVPGIGKRILLAGNDEMTFDMARMLRERYDEVTVLSRWSRGSMEAKTGAVELAIEEGVNLVTGVEVVSVEQKDGKAYNAVCKVISKGYTITVPCDTLILGGGGPDIQAVAMNNLRLDMDEKTGHITVDHNLATSIKGVFAIGDLDMSAADAGRAGALAVANYLAGIEGYISLGNDEAPETPTDHEMIEGRKKEPISVREEGCIALDGEAAAIEASRCMHCGYHSHAADKCMGCGVCAKVCPVNAIEMISVDEAYAQSKEV